MKSFEEFADRVDDLLAQVAGPAAGIEMFLRAKGGGVFNGYYDDGSRWTEEQARDVAGHIIRQIQQDAEFVKTTLAGVVQSRVTRGAWQSRVDASRMDDGTLMFSGAVRDGSECWRSGAAARE
jgi:hypothetical protein